MLFKNSLIVCFLIISNAIIAQQENIYKGTISGSLESTSQLYQEDNKIQVSLPQDRMASNNYLSLNYSYGKFLMGVQYEAYMPPLVGYSPKYEGSGIVHKYFSYKNDFIEFTVGNFYEQFGSGVLFRVYEDRQLGLNNSLNGVKIRVHPTDFFSIKGVYGKQRYYFEESDGIVRGLDGELDILKMFSIQKKWSIKAGSSLLSHYQVYTGPDIDFPSTVNAYSGRIRFNSSHFSMFSEYVSKESDPHAQNYFWLKTGNALLTDFSYTRNRLAMNMTLRRLENMDSRSQREAIDNDLLLNYLPANTKQHKYSLANIYPYSTQSIGEIGGQYSLFYKIKKGHFLGGKYGTKINFNFSISNSLDTTNLGGLDGFESKFLAFGKNLYYQDINIEIDKKWNKKLKTIFGYINQKYNKAQVEGGSYPMVYSNIAFFDAQYKMTKKTSIRSEIQHLSTKEDMKNWAAILLELNFAPKWSVYANDMYNYGNDMEKLHYYIFGTSFIKDSHRIELAYARQRESLLCVGGVCRKVPAFKGFTLNITSTF